MSSKIYEVPMGLVWMFLGVAMPLCLATFFVGRARAQGWLDQGDKQLSSAVNFFGYYPALVCFGVVSTVFAINGIFGDGIIRHLLKSELPNGFAGFSPTHSELYFNQVKASLAVEFQTQGEHNVFMAVRNRYQAISSQLNLISIIGAIGASLVAVGAIFATTTPSTRVRARVEKIFEYVLLACAAVAILTTIGIIISLVSDSWRFFGKYPFWKFLFGTEWNAQTEAASSFGAVPLFFGTVVIALIAMTVALPVGLFSAVFLSEFASAATRGWVKPVLEVLAGIPTVVYGFFAILVISPLVQLGAGGINELIHTLGGPDSVLSAASKNALSAGFVMGIMIVPFVSSLSDDVIRAVPQNIRDGALALGATKSESISQVVLPAAFPGIIAATLLAISRAIGETMIVVMAAGQSAQITSDLTAEITTVTVQIVASMTLDAEFDSATALSAFALGLVLFAFTLVFNLVSFSIVNRYRRRYS